MVRKLVAHKESVERLQITKMTFVELCRRKKTNRKVFSGEMGLFELWGIRIGLEA